MPGSCSDRRRGSSAANAGFIFVLLQRVAHALGVGEGCTATASYPEVRSDHHHANSVRTTPSLCADMIFGRDRSLALNWTAPHPWTRLLAFFRAVSVRAGRVPLTD